VSEKELVFNFYSDYVSSHLLDIEIKLYDSFNNLIRIYTNQISFIGKKRAVTDIDFLMNNDFYVLVSVFYNDELIVENAKLNFYFQEDCKIDDTNKTCNRIYKSEYKEKVSKDIFTEFKVKDSSFNNFLKFNELKMNEIQFYSEYDFSKSDIYLFINEEINGFDIIYDNGYRFILDVVKNGYYHFEVIDDYYVDIVDFKYKDSYFNGSVKTQSIHFPFNKDYKEYSCKIMIASFINIEIVFRVAISDNLLGDCKESKYCLIGVKYD